MAIKILMPALSPTMEEGTLAKWHKKEGETVEIGDVVAEIETDKATMEVEAVDEGTLGKIVVAEGTENVKVNAVIGVLLEEGEDGSVIDDMDLGEGAAAVPQAEAAPASPKQEAGKQEVEEAASAPPPSAPSATEAVATLSTETKAPPAPVGDSGDRVKASPLARRMAKQAGIDLTQLPGSGPHGRIVKMDIETAISAGTGKAAPATAPTGPAVVGERRSPDEVKLSNVRKIIAKRMTEADRDVPQIYLTIDCEIDRLLAARKEINEAADGTYKVSVNDLVVKACAHALRKVPDLNAQWDDERILRHNTVDIAVAVAYDGGLITPIIFDSDIKGVSGISEEMKELAGRAREGKLKPEEYQGGTFSVSNMGMYGISHFTSIINPPHAAILAVGAGEERAVVRDGEIKIATIMSVTLTCDHRVVDGALGAQWLQAFKGFIERPATMLA